MGDEDDSDFELIVLTGAYLLNELSRKKRKPHRFYIHPYLEERRAKGRFMTAFQDMRKDPDIFKANFRLTPTQFDSLLALLEPQLGRKQRSRPDTISACEKLAVTLEYLAAGALQRHIASCYRISKSALTRIIRKTCDTIISSLSNEVMKSPTMEQWLEISNRYNTIWNFPNCAGSIDGKHCALKSPPNAGSLFYNHKGFHSIVLMAVADADYKFVTVDIGAYGSESDASVFGGSKFGSKLLSDSLNLPEDQTLHGKKMPFLFIADDAFPLTRRIMKPFKPNKGQILSIPERIFNYRLSRARRCVENAFGILCARWQCLARTMYVSPDMAQKIIGACCVLHNYLMRSHREDYSPPGFSDSYDEEGTFIPGSFRDAVPDRSLFNSHGPKNQQRGRSSNNAVRVRELYKQYFNSKEGELKFQMKRIFLSNIG